MARITRSRAKLSATANGASNDGTAMENVAGNAPNKETDEAPSNECHENTEEIGMEEAGTMEQPHSDDDEGQYDMEDAMFEPLVLDSVKDEDDTHHSAEADAEPRESQEEGIKDEVYQPESNEDAQMDSVDNPSTADDAAVKEEYRDDAKEMEEPCAGDSDEKLNEAEFQVVSEVKDECEAGVADADVNDEGTGNCEVDDAVAEQEEDADEKTMLVTHYQDLCPPTMLPEEKCITDVTREIVEREVKALIEKLLYEDEVSCSKPGAEELKAYGCNLCGVTIGHPGRFEIHSNSRKHLQYLRWVNGINLNKEQGQFYCGVCRVSLPGKDVMSSHWKSDRHSCLSKLFNVDEYYATHVMERVSGQATKSLQGSPQKTSGKQDDRTFPYKEGSHTERQGVRSGQTPSSKQEYAPVAEQPSRQNVQVTETSKSGKVGFRCDLCDVTVARKSFLEQHFNGKRHRSQVRRAAEHGFGTAKIPQGNLCDQGQLSTPNFYEDFEGSQWEDLQQNRVQEQSEITKACCPEQGQGDQHYRVQSTSEEEMLAESAEELQRSQEYDEGQIEQNYEGDAGPQEQEDEVMRDGYEDDGRLDGSLQAVSEEDEQHLQNWNDVSAEQAEVEEEECNENGENEYDHGGDGNDKNICTEEAEEYAPADDGDDENAGAEEEQHVGNAGATPNEGAPDAAADVKKDEEKSSEDKEGKDKAEDKSRRDSRRDSHHGHSSSRDSHRHSRSDARREVTRDSRRSTGDSRGRRHSASSSKDAKGSGADSKDKESKSDAKDAAKGSTRSDSRAKSGTENKDDSRRDTKRDSSKDTKGDPKGDSKNDPKRRSSDAHHSRSRDHKSTLDTRHRRSPRPRTPPSASRDQRPSSSTLRRRTSPVVRDADRGVRRRVASPERPMSSKKPKYSCFACKVAIFSDRDYKEHFDSRRHRQEVERREKKEEEERAARRRSSSPRSHRRRDRSRSPADHWRITAPLVTQPHPTADPAFMNAQWLNPAAFLPLQQQLQQHPQQHLAQLQSQQHLHQLAPQHLSHLQQQAQQQQCLPEVFGVGGTLPQTAAPAAQALPLESYTERRPVVAGALDNMILLQQRLLTLASATGGNAGATMPITQDYGTNLQAHQNTPQQADPVSRRTQDRSMQQSSLRQSYKDTPSYNQSKQTPSQQQVPFMEGSRGRMHQDYNAGSTNSHMNYRSSTADPGSLPYFAQKDNRPSSHGIPSQVTPPQVTPRDSYNQPFQQPTTNPSSRYGNVLDTSIGNKGQSRTDSQPSPLSRNQRSQFMRPGMNSMKAGDVDNSYQFMQKRF